MAPRKKPSAKTNRAACDVLWSQLVRLPGRCQVCGTAHNLEAAHIVPRIFAWTRSDLANGVCLCRQHHRAFHGDDARWQNFLDATIGRTEYERLWAKARAGVNVKFDWSAERQRLKALHGAVYR